MARVRASLSSWVVASVLAVLVVGTTAPAASGAGPTVVYHGSRHRAWIALTIDDGYNAANCRKIADILRTRHVPATYFPYARVISNAPATWRSITARGFRIGNHTVSHPFMTRLSYTDQLRQITRAKRILGAETGRAMLPLFRPPYGSWNATTRRAAAAAGIRYLVLWDTTFADTAVMSDAAHFRHAMRGTRGSIILLHCGPGSSVRILPRVIAAYRARGLTFVTVEEMLHVVPTPRPTPTASPTPTATPPPEPTPTAASTPEPTASPG